MTKLKRLEISEKISGKAAKPKSTTSWRNEASAHVQAISATKAKIPPVDPN